PTIMLPAIMLTIIALATFATAPCDSLLKVNFDHTTITMAQVVEAGKFVAPAAPRSAAPPRGENPADEATPPAGRGGQRGPAPNPYANVPAFCRVAATLKPTNDSDIKIEVWMPVSGWNNKLLAVGNGAWAGTISYNAMA